MKFERIKLAYLSRLLKRIEQTEKNCKCNIDNIYRYIGRLVDECDYYVRFFHGMQELAEKSGVRTGFSDSGVDSRIKADGFFGMVKYVFVMPYYYLKKLGHWFVTPFKKFWFNSQIFFGSLKNESGNYFKRAMKGIKLVTLTNFKELNLDEVVGGFLSTKTLYKNIYEKKPDVENAKRFMLSFNPGAFMDTEFGDFFMAVKEEAHHPTKNEILIFDINSVDAQLKENFQNQYKQLGELNKSKNPEILRFQRFYRRMQFHFNREIGLMEDSLKSLSEYTKELSVSTMKKIGKYVDVKDIMKKV